MTILAFDTSFDACSAAAMTAREPGRAARRLEAMATGHAERLLPMIGDVLGDLGLCYGDVRALAVTVGPGSFTGTRIAVAAARALSLALGIPVHVASSLTLIAWTAADRLGTVDDGELCVAIDARREEIYWQRHDARTLAALGPPRLATPTQAVAEIEAARALVIGSAAAAVVAAAGRAAPRVIEARLPDILPDALSLARRAADLPVAVHPEPLYLRPPDAKPQSGKSIERVGA